MGLPGSSSSRVPGPSRLLPAGQTLNPVLSVDPKPPKRTVTTVGLGARSCSSLPASSVPQGSATPSVGVSGHRVLCAHTSHWDSRKENPLPPSPGPNPQTSCLLTYFRGAGAMAGSEMQTALSPALPHPPKRPKRATVGDSRVSRQPLPSCMPCAHLQVDSWSSVNVGDRRLWPQQQS